MGRFAVPAVAALVSMPVRLIRALDRRGGFASRRGEAAYSRLAPRLAGPLHRRIVRDVVERLGDRPGVTIVDLGSGPGTLARELGRRLPSANVVGVEPNRRMRTLADLAGPAGPARQADRPGNVRFVDGSAERLPFPDASIDLLVSSLSAHHWSDLDAAVREIRRIIRPGGAAWIHDLRFATFTAFELDAARLRLRLPPGAIRRSVPRGQGRLPLMARIDIDPELGQTAERAI
jgi:SAM-dependent methyltransferase